MNVTKNLVKVFVIPEHAGHQNVIRRVLWNIRFEQDGATSDAGVETFLDVDNIQTFIPADQVGNDRLLEWVYAAQGGDAFLAQIQPFHEEQVAYAKQCNALQTYTTGFDFMTGVTPTTIPAAVL